MLLAITGIVLIWLGIRIGRIVLDRAEPYSPDTGNDDVRLVEAGSVVAPTDFRGAGNSRASATGTLTGLHRTHSKGGM